MEETWFFYQIVVAIREDCTVFRPMGLRSRDEFFVRAVSRDRGFLRMRSLFTSRSL